MARDGDRRAAHVKFRKGGKLRKWLAHDAHLASFLHSPSKDNGLDVEGIAAHGLRVCSGHAVILELDFKDKGGILGLRKLDGKARYRKQMLDTDARRARSGHGRRRHARADRHAAGGSGGLCAALARYLRRHRAWSYNLALAVTQALTLPGGEADNTHEGLGWWEIGAWLIVYDSPNSARLSVETEEYQADIWHLPG